MCSDCWALQSYRSRTALQIFCDTAAQSRSPKLNKCQQQLLRKSRAANNLRRICEPQIKRGPALIIAQTCAAKNSRRNGAIAKPKLNMRQQQLPRKTVLQRICVEAVQSRSLKSNTGQPQLPRKATLQRICGAVAQSRSPRLSKGQQPLSHSRKSATTPNTCISTICVQSAALLGNVTLN